jgi:hypothetical protein
LLSSSVHNSMNSEFPIAKRFKMRNVDKNFFLLFGWNIDEYISFQIPHAVSFRIHNRRRVSISRGVLVLAWNWVNRSWDRWWMNSS